jgi:NADH-quinone oxidoreductase subunit G
MALSFIADGRLIQAAPEQNLLAAGLAAQLDIPYFCWHPAMGAVGSCRQCAVKIFDGPSDATGRIVMACMTKPLPGMRISVDDPEAAAFRETVVEMVLTSHPHDCPVCEVGGQCHLQDMAVLTGHSRRRYHFPKRTHLNQNLGPLIRHEMNRCIGCYRCVRFYRDYAGGGDFGVFGAARQIYFGRAEDGTLESNFAGNLVEVCPTGVFVDKPFSANFRRNWDLRVTPSVCPHCATGCNITLHEREGGIRRVTNRYNETLNGYFLCDRGRFGVGFLNSQARLRAPRDRAGNALTQATARERLAAIFADQTVIGIGSPRASVEANFALRALVGETNFYAGVSTFDAAVLQTSLAIMRQIRPATLQQTEQADAFLLLGDDPAAIAPRLALALRQAARRADEHGAARKTEPNPFMTSAPVPGWLDDVARRVTAGTGDLFADADVTGVLLAAARPVIVAGGDPSLLVRAANLVLALRRKGVGAQLCLLLPEANSVGLGLLDCRDLGAAAQTAFGRHVIVLERDILRDPANAANIFAAAKSVTVLDHIATPSVEHADLAVGVASFAEADGAFINLEGRVQNFFAAMAGAPAAWQLLRDAAIAAGRLDATLWETHADLRAAIAGEITELAAWPAVQHALAAPLSYRHSGRAAAGDTIERGVTAAPLDPGWNSVQVQQRLPVSSNTEIFLFEDQGTGDIEIPLHIPLDDRVLGIEDLSSLSPAIIAYRASIAP